MKILEKILYYGLILTLLTPLVIGESLIFPFVSIKAYFFYILIDILFIIYLILLSQKAIYPKHSKLLLIFIGLTLFGFILDLFGISFKNSLWGNYERMMGIYTALHLLLYLWLLLSIFNHNGKYYKLLNFSLVVSLFVSIYGFLQYFKVNFFGIVLPADDRIIATFGNAAFLAGFVLIFVFVALYLFFKTNSKYWRIFYAISIIANIVILFMTATRGALIGLVFGLLVMLVLLILFYKSRKIKIVSGVVLLAMILFSWSIFVFKDLSFVKNNLALRRISEINLQEATTTSRLSLWKMSLKASMDRPIVGYGENNVRIPLDRYHDYNLVEDWFDSSHNKFFDELLAHGFVGFLAQLGFFGWLLWVIFRKRQQDMAGSIILISLFLAYLAQAMFIFDSFVLSVSLFLVFGLIFVRDSHDQEKLILNKKLSIYISMPIGIIMIIVLSWLYTNSISGANHIAKAFSFGNVDITEATDIYKMADDELFTNYDILAPTMAQTAVNIFDGDNYIKYTDVQLKNFMGLLEVVYNQAIDDSGGYSKFYVNLAKIYQLASRHPRLDYVDKSIELLNKSLENSPGRIDTYYALAQGYFLKENIVKAENTLKKALEFGARQATTYYNLAQIQARKGDSREAIFSINQATQAGYNFTISSLEEFAKIFIARDDWPATIDVFLKMNDIYPDNLDIYYNIALAYSKNGQKKEAVEWANKILEKDLSRKEEVKRFINSL